MITNPKTKDEQWQESLRMLLILGKVIKEDHDNKRQKQNAEGEKD